jgi:hypothetical protein
MTTSNRTDACSVESDTVTFTLTGDMIGHFAGAVRDELQADLEQGHPEYLRRHDVLAHIDLLNQRVRILDALDWGEATEATLTMSARSLQQTVTTMLDSGDLGPMTRSRYAQAGAAFAILDQITAAEAAR